MTEEQAYEILCALQDHYKRFGVKAIPNKLYNLRKSTFISIFSREDRSVTLSFHDYKSNYLDRIYPASWIIIGTINFTQPLDNDQSIEDYIYSNFTPQPLKLL